MPDKLPGVDADSNGASEVPRSQPGASVLGPRAAGPADPVTGVAPFVGRVRELAVLRAALEDTQGGRARLVLLAGEAGIGKTRTAEEVGAQARAQGMQVLWGRCYEGEGAPAFWPWVQLLRAASKRLPDDALRAALGWGGAELTHLVPELRERLPDLSAAAVQDSAQARFRLFESIARFLENLSHQSPLVCIIDDLHGGDRSSLRLLEFVARELRDVSALLVGTYRDGAAVIGHPLTELVVEALRLPGAERLTLSGLSLAEVAELVERTSGVRPAQSVVAAVYQQTEGNPLFAGEYVRLLLARHNSSALADPQALRSLPVPDSVRAVVRHRVTPLSSTCRAVLNVAAVIGREFHRDVVESVIADDADIGADASVFAALDEAAAAGIVGEGLERGGRYRFVHAVMREALYEELGSRQRQQLHGRVGEVLAERAPVEEHLAELAHHFYVAGAGADRGRTDRDTAAAVEYARRAAARAMTTLACEEAARLYQLALAGLDRQGVEAGPERCAVLVDLGVAQNAAGDLPASKATLAQAAALAERLGMREELGRAALHYGTKLVWGGQPTPDPGLLGLLEKALVAWAETDGPLHVRLLARLAIALRMSDENERRTAASDSALAMARRLGDPAVIAYALHAWHAAQWRADNLDDRLTVATELTQRATDVNDLELRFEGHAWRVDDLLERGDRPAVEAEIDACQQLADGLRQPAYRYRMQTFRGMLLMIDGRFAEAEQLAQESVELGKTVLYDTAAWFAAQMVAYSYTQGRRDRFEVLAGAIGTFASDYPVTLSYLCMSAYIASELGDVPAARSGFERLARREFDDFPRDHMWLLLMNPLTEACVFIGDRGRAATLAGLLEPFAARAITFVPGVAYLGPVSHCLGLLETMLERWDDAERHFEQALAMNRRMQARPCLARTQYEYARMLLARDRAGDRDQAQAMLGEALATAHELGMQLLEERVAGLSSPVPGSEMSVEQSAVGIQQPPTTMRQPEPGVFRREGQYWTIVYDGTLLRLKDTKGLQYIHHLLRHPGQEFLALDVIDCGLRNADGGMPDSSQSAVRNRRSAIDDAPLLDAQAKAEYRERLRDLRAELDEAVQFNDLGRKAKLQTEIDFISQQLSAAVGLHGKDRKSGAAERARLTVTKRIKGALKAIAAVHAPLAQHLRAGVKTGYVCVYTASSPPVRWGF